MRATFFGLEVGKRAILTQRAAMDVTSHNIANANTEGYARQRAVLSATNPWCLPSFNAPVTGQQLGTGVEATKIESLRDLFIDERIVRETSTLKENEIGNDLMKEVEAILNEPNEDTVRSMLDKFWAAWEDLSISPSLSELRANLTESAESVIAFFKDLDDRLRNLQGTPDHASEGSIENQIEDTVTQANTLIDQIAAANVDIETAELADGKANDLRDRRQKLVEELSKLLEIDTDWDSKGHLRVRAGSELLVDHSQSFHLFVVQKDADLPNTVSVEGDYPELSDKPEVATVALSHTADRRNITLAVEQTAQAHEVHTYLSFFPLNGSLAQFGVTSGTVTINGRRYTIDAEHTTMEDLALMFDSGNLNIDSRINEGGQLVLTSALTGTANAMTFENGTSNLFTVLNLQTSRKAQDAVFTFGGDRYVSASNVVRDLVPGAVLELRSAGLAHLDLRPIITGGRLKGLLEVRDGNIHQLRDRLDKMAWTLATEVNDAHRQGFGLDGVSGRNFFKLLVSDDPNQPYKDAMKNLALEDHITNDLNTIAAAGGTLENPTDRLPTYNGDGDGSNAIKIAQIKHKGWFNNGKDSFNEFYGEIVTQVAVESQTYERQYTYTSDLMTQLDSSRQSLSGVSLDEELTNLLKFQHAYNAAAKAISTVDAMLDKIINGMI
ncbi:MAG: flagellar hook-associated protein FlgK [Candidatus Riflebacteria bacterium]|nr:flagellar hook-associated protein FlgK [Candidatus Riflebacteria bacterium]